MVRLASVAAIAIAAAALPVGCGGVGRSAEDDFAANRELILALPSFPGAVRVGGFKEEGVISAEAEGDILLFHETTVRLRLEPGVRKKDVLAFYLASIPADWRRREYRGGVLACFRRGQSRIFLAAVVEDAPPGWIELSAIDDGRGLLHCAGLD